MMESKARYFLAVALGVASIGYAHAAVSGRPIANNTPRFLEKAKKLGPADPAQIIEVVVWLNPHNREELDNLAEEIYNRNSSHFHNWLTRAELANRFAPTAKEARTVGEFLSRHNLPVVAIGPDNFSVRGRGTLRDVEAAFHVDINNYQFKGQTYRANSSDPSIDDVAAELIGSISGLDDLRYKHPLAKRTSPKQSSTEELQAAAGANSSEFFTTNCFTGPETETFSGTDLNFNGASATYTGNTYNGTHNYAGCGYTPQEIWTAYNLTGLYKEGFDGTGQTIVIIDWCGSPTIEADANAFSQQFGLPPLDKSNFHIYFSSTTPTCGNVPDPEINIDVEWAHAIAPGAKIALVVPPSPSFMDVDDAQIYAIANGLGNVISGSYGSEELYTPLSVLNEENLLNQLAAVLGISANFSTGDDGDFTFDLASTNITPSVSAPADSPYATGVGGVTLALKGDNTIKWQTGWGNNQNALSEFGFVFDPPAGFFLFGSGGGPSAVFAKPRYQHALPGTQRLLPDISWLADPYTGGVIAITEPFVYPIEFTSYGGTSLACPMFSALWAIANQEAGAPLGQAARHLYAMPAGIITDVLPLNPLLVHAAKNVTGTITDPTGTTFYSAAQLAAPLNVNTDFLSALWDVPLDNVTVLLTFGTDTGLTTTPGWDNVTGLGTPNGKAFADYFNPAK